MSEDAVGTFQVHTRRSPGALVVAPQGELDLTGAPRLLEAVRSDGGRERVVIDLESVSFMDSSGLRALIEARRISADLGRGFALARPSDAVMRVLQLVDLTAEFELLDAPPV
jgi:anti-sigma B factor antagonist